MNKIFTIFLRLVACAAALAAALMKVMGRDSMKILDLTFKYFVLVEGAASGYSLLTLFLSWKKPSRRFLIITDVVVAVFLSSSVSASLARANAEERANEPAGSFPICGQLPKLCSHEGSLVAGFVAAVLYLVILLYSLYTTLDPLIA